jgi:hypothetical protein
MTTKIAFIVDAEHNEEVQEYLEEAGILYETETK